MSIHEVLHKSRKELRAALDSSFDNDADFTAFCIDYFPEIHKRITPGMERQQKLNLLLELSSPATLSESLNAASQTVLSPSRRGTNRSSGASRYGRWIGVFLGLFSIYAIYELLAQPSCSRLSVFRDDLTNKMLLPRPQEHQLLSHPDCADVFYLDNGQAIGRTPLAMASLRRPATVVIRKAGFQDSKIDIPEQVHDSIFVNLLSNSKTNHRSIPPQKLAPLIY